MAAGMPMASARAGTGRPIITSTCGAASERNVIKDEARLIEPGFFIGEGDSSSASPRRCGIARTRSPHGAEPVAQILQSGDDGRHLVLFVGMWPKLSWPAKEE